MNTRLHKERADERQKSSCPRQPHSLLALQRKLARANFLVIRALRQMRSRMVRLWRLKCT